MQLDLAIFINVKILFLLFEWIGCSGEQLDQILDFAFLEPEDDPRHYCFLTVVAQKTSESHVAPYALLYSLTYVNKDVVPEGGILYDDLQYITLRLDLNFGSLIVKSFSSQDFETLDWRCIFSPI